VSAGGLIICRHNEYSIEAAEPRRPLANGDILRIEAITEREIPVHRLLDPDLATDGAGRHSPAGWAPDR
jgi:hypothetical protein